MRFIPLLIILALTLGYQECHAASFKDTMRKFFAATFAMPQTRGLQDEACGYIAVMQLEQRLEKVITPADGYRSPIFRPGDASILAIKGESIVECALADAKEEKILFSKPGLEKLITFDPADPDKCLLLFKDKDGVIRAGVLSLRKGKLGNVHPYDKEVKEERGMMAYLLGSIRIYGDISLYEEKLSKTVMGGIIEYGDIFMRKGTDKPENITQSDGYSCGQPALSYDQKTVVYVKTAQ